ncbi:MAG: tetratricopeptide repeat protein [Candidatus Vogelbacteria bacterium]|nr:tetratricopeptide repeat protein [Candidatus Vogelbacteria bacterium]
MQELEVDIIVDDENVEVEGAPRTGFFRKLPFVGKLSYFVFFLTIILIPLIVPPLVSGIQIEFAKKLLFSGGILLSFFLWLITRLEDGRLEFPGGLVFWTSLSVLASFLISSLLSSSVGQSLFGLGFENDTFISITLLFLSLFLASTFFESKKRLAGYIFGLLLSLAVIGALQLVQVIHPGIVFLGGTLTNFIGKLNDLGVLFGLSTILSLLILEFIPNLASGKKRLMHLFLIVSLIIVALVNYDLIWAIIGIFTLIIFIYSLAYGGLLQPIELADDDDNEQSRVGWIKKIVYRPSFVVFVLCLILFFSTNGVGSFLGSYGIFQLEVRPSWQSTIDVARRSMKKDLFFGSGPNTFSEQWAALKPQAVNGTAFWNTDFNVGFGRIPSLAVTLGLFGVLSFSIFLLSLIYLGLKSILRPAENIFDQLLVFSSFVAALYLWSFSVFYVTDTVILVLTFIFTGIFIASLSRVEYIRNYEFQFFNNPRLGFISVLVLVILIISTVSCGYLLGRKFLAVYNFQKGLYSANILGDAISAERRIKAAISLDEQDLYYRSLADLYVLELKNLLSGQSTLTKETLLSKLQAVLSASAGNARRATEIDPNNYLNWITLARVGQTVVPLKGVVAGSYDLALNSYNKALSITPENPNIYLGLAQLEVAKGDIGKAKVDIDLALQKKGNFTDALFLLSQIEANQGSITGAIKSVEQALVFSPQDMGILFQLGFLRYLNKDYSGAVGALSQAVILQPNYSNAKYFLGLSYSKLGKINEAISQFKDIANLNPTNTEVKTILGNLSAGRGALENIVAPKSEPSDPAKRSKPPVREIVQ